jgi:hypothetical protein
MCPAGGQSASRSLEQLFEQLFILINDNLSGNVIRVPVSVTSLSAAIVCS